jgi:hypothetical protein
VARGVSQPVAVWITLTWGRWRGRWPKSRNMECLPCDKWGTMTESRLSTPAADAVFVKYGFVPLH